MTYNITLQYLSQCDTVIMMKNGRIQASGTHEDLVAKDNEYCALIDTYRAEHIGKDGPNVWFKSMRN